MCWTEVPSTLKSLGSQRARWQNGLAEVLWLNRDMLLNPRYGRIGLVAIPYQWLLELFAPVIEVCGWALMLIATLSGLLSSAFFVSFFVLGYLMGVFISIAAVLMEEMAYHRYNDWRDLIRLIALCFLEYFPYRPLNTLWRIKGLWYFLTGQNTWQPMERVGFAPQPSD